MKLSEKLGLLGDRLLVIGTSIIAFLMLTYSGYALYDSFYTGQNAFSSYDLQQYRPVQKESGEVSFEELFAITPDAVGWIFISGTNIDYPVVQGRDNLEYANKDIYGKSSLTGAIYLAAENQSGFVDAYNIIYGHHMDNGAMFGDVDKFRDKEFFDSHRTGVVQTPTGNFDLRVYACIQIDAYESMIYKIGSYENEEILAFVKENAINIAEDFDPSSITKLIMLSTCEDAETNGRLVLVCGATPRTEAFIRETEKTENIVRRAIGHITDSDHWALLNLLCVILTIYILLPLGYVRRKYRQPGFARRVANEIEDYDENSAISTETDNSEEKQRQNALDCDNIWISGLARENRMDDREDLVRDLRTFVKKILVGGIIEIITAIVAFQVFLRTEDIFSPMVVRDEWTILMILISAAALVVDFICFRYRGTGLPEVEEDYHSKN